MNVLTLQQELRDFAASIGVDKIGFTTAAPFVDLKHLLKQQQELNYQSGFEEENIELRTEPTLLLEEAASIIAIAVAYPSRMKMHLQGKKERVVVFFAALHGGQISYRFTREVEGN